MNDNLQQTMTLWPGSAPFSKRPQREPGFEVWSYGKIDLIHDTGIDRWRCQCGGVGTPGWHDEAEAAYFAFCDKGSEWAKALAEVTRFSQACAQGSRIGFESSDSEKEGSFKRNRTSMCGFYGER